MKGYLSDKDYSFIYSNSARVCVDILIKKGKGIWLVKRSTPPYKWKWNFAGGRIRFRETISDAIKRLSKTELGISVSNPVMVGFTEALREIQNREKRHSISLVFKCIVNKLPTKGKVCYKTDNLHPVHKRFLIDHQYYE